MPEELQKDIIKVIALIHIKINKKLAQKTINELREDNVIDANYLIKHDNNYVYIPVKMPLKNYEIIDIDGNRKDDNNTKISFSYDVIGDMAIIKGKTENEVNCLAKELIKRKNIDRIYLDTGISGEFRTRSLKLIYGNDKKETLYHENSINLMVNMDKAYFSPRLSTERLRISNEINENEYIIDMFCGIGPFSILIAKKTKCNIIAMDKNPDAIELLRANIKLNKLKGDITPLNGDSEELVKNYNNVDRIIMNLPHNAYDFLDVAFKALKTKGIINYYEICDLDTLEKRMEFFKNSGFEIVYKRIVHGFSKYMNMYSIEIKKI